MRQCPDCEEKDRVVIAGKVFCANCGTPWEPADPSESAAYAKKIGTVATQPFSTPEKPAESAATPATAPKPTVAAPAPETTTPATPPAQPAMASSNVGSEIPSLDAKDESVLSDDQMKEMVQAQINNLSQEAVTEKATDVVPDAPIAPTSEPIAAPTPEAPAQPAPSLSPQTTSVPSVVSAEAQAAAPAPTPAPVVPAAEPVAVPPAPVVVPASTAPVNTGSAESTAPVVVAQGATPSPTPSVDPTPATSALPPTEPVAIPQPAPSASSQSPVAASEPVPASTEAPVQAPASAPILVVPPAPVVAPSTPAPESSTATSAAPAPELSLDPNTVAVASSTGSKVMNDILAPAPVVMAASVSTAAPVQASAPAAMPNANTVATPAPDPKLMAQAATVPMMSRDEALKLALGDQAAAESAPKTGPAKPTAIVMSVIALGLFGALMWKSNYPDLVLRVASMRAGLTASMPGFMPVGWSKAQNVKTGQGLLSYTLIKNSNSLQIEQQKTEWDSQAVLEQFVLKRSKDYLVMQASGLTIYMFGDNQAAWVNQGTLYTITGQHGLSQEDIIRMATSL